jgi:D-proline reductase (dithiol) PrdB
LHLAILFVRHVNLKNCPSIESKELSVMSISRKCVPFTPFDRKLEKSTIAIVSAGGVHLKEQEPFNIADELGDLSYRVFPAEVEPAIQRP